MKFKGMTSFERPPHPEDRAALARLAELDVFPGASDKDLRAIVRSGTVVSIPQGWSLIWEKTPADKAYVVLQGTASARHDHQEFATIGPGELIGEMAIIQHKLRSATVVAAAPLEVLHFTKEAVDRLRREVEVFRQAIEVTTVSRSA
jgi:CRP/FNR family cyclic AMP-dependent transcriptional regulator